LGNDDRKAAYRSLAKLAADTLMDRIAIQPPGEATRKLAAAYFEKLSEVEIDLVELHEEWLQGEMAAALDEARIDVVGKLFK
jgi:hypothetical protein